MPVATMGAGIGDADRRRRPTVRRGVVDAEQQVTLDRSLGGVIASVGFQTQNRGVQWPLPSSSRRDGFGGVPAVGATLWRWNDIGSGEATGPQGL